MSRRVMLVLLAVIFTGPAAAEDGLVAAPAAAVQVNAAVAQPSAAGETVNAVMEFDVNESGNVTFDFRDADIKNVLKVLAYKSKVNIIAGPEVVGLVNIQLKNVPWQKALDVILSTYGYSYEQKGTIITVTTVANMKKRREDAKELADQEALSTRTFVLSFSKAEDVVKSLEKMKSARGSINFDQRTNAVIINDVEGSLSSLAEVVKRLDTVTPQILIEARIIETALDSSEKLGLKWPTSIGASATFPIRTHTFPWSAERDKYLPATSWANPKTLGDKTVSDDGTATNMMTYGTLSIADLGLTLDMLQSRANTNVLSNPRIVTLDNQPAKIMVGSKYPLPKYAYSDTQEKLTISGWEYIEYGLTFTVTPHINGKGVVTLDVAPEIIDQSSSVVFDFGGGVGTSIPVLTNESAKTNVMIRDGETLVIAGLIKDKKTKTTRKVPILGDIPLLGLLFRNKEDSVIKTELVIFITPHIITLSADQPAVK